MIDAECLLRLRGLPKQKISPKARLLHHIYTWVRIVGESTYLLHDYNPSDSFIEAFNHQFRTDHETVSQRNPCLDDFLRLQPRQSDSDLDIDQPKDKEVGLHDIHLQDSRQYPETLYSQIYGIPETWLSLVSQTTRTANVLDSLRIARRTHSNLSLGAWETVQRRRVRLENMICSFDLTRARTSDSSPNEHMLRALNSDVFARCTLLFCKATWIVLSLHWQVSIILWNRVRIRDLAQPGLPFLPAVRPSRVRDERLCFSGLKRAGYSVDLLHL